MSRGKDIEDRFKIHNLRKLHSFVLGAIPNLKPGILDAAVRLEPYYVESRYPGDMPEFPWQQIADAVKLASMVREEAHKLLEHHH